jgi:hypothetical protein
MGELQGCVTRQADSTPLPSDAASHGRVATKRNLQAFSGSAWRHKGAITSPRELPGPPPSYLLVEAESRHVLARTGPYQYPVRNQGDLESIHSQELYQKSSGL